MLNCDAIARIRVLVVGDVMLDRYWYGDVDRISPEAPVPVARIVRSEERAGGAANVALNIRALGAQCSLVSVLGADEPGGSLKRILSGCDIRLFLSEEAAAATTVKLRIFARNQQLLRADFDTSPTHEVLANCLGAFRDALADTDVVLISDYGRGGLLHIHEMIRQARAIGKPVLIDPKGDDFSRYRDASIVTPNRAEFERVVGAARDSDEMSAKAARLIEELGLEGLLVTQSGDGMVMYRRDGRRCHSPARAREVYDVSGAGDTVIGALSIAVAAGAPDEVALRFANAAAGVVVGKLGTATASWEEVAPLLEGADQT